MLNRKAVEVEQSLYEGYKRLCVRIFEEACCDWHHPYIGQWLMSISKRKDNGHFCNLVIGQAEIIEFANSDAFDMYNGWTDIDPAYASRKFIDSLRRDNGYK